MELIQVSRPCKDTRVLEGMLFRLRRSGLEGVIIPKGDTYTLFREIKAGEGNIPTDWYWEWHKDHWVRNEAISKKYRKGKRKELRQWFLQQK
jgi:hypothetical protein